MGLGLIQINFDPIARDHRRELLRAAAAAGARVIHVECNAAITVTEIAKQTMQAHAVASVDAFKAMAPDLFGEGAVVLTGLGGKRSPLAQALSRCFPRRACVYDVNDDLSYAATGLKALKFFVRDRTWRSICGQAMVMERGMLKAYRGAWHVPNASHLRPVGGAARGERAVYIGSIDERVDFGLMRDLGERMDIDIWGAVHERAPWAAEALERLTAERPRIRFRGGYRNEELGEILADYGVGLIPYVVGHRMTDHVALDKLHHFLNAGLGVVATPMPYARQMGAFIGLMTTADDYAEAAAAAMANRAAWRVEENTWDARWVQIQALAAKAQL